VDEEWLGMGKWCVFTPWGGSDSELAEPMGRESRESRIGNTSKVTYVLKIHTIK
jgi:hypothetical protein